MSSLYSRSFGALLALGICACIAQEPTRSPQTAAPKPPSVAPPKPAPPPKVIAAASGRWRVQYFYDQSKSALTIQDLRFVSRTRGVAVGTIVENSRQKHVALVTSDGGEQWQTVPVSDAPISLDFLNENLGWMVTRNNLWRTTEAGKNWQKVGGFPPYMLVVHFLNEHDGIAAGARKKVYETHDGGGHWKALPAAAEPPGDSKYSVYNWISFATPELGIVIGGNHPPRPFEDRGIPEWMDPEAAMGRRVTPHLSYGLVTTDGGKTWKANSSSIFGDITRLRLGGHGLGLGLLEYGNSFRYRSEVYTIAWPSGQNRTIFRDRRFAVTDLWMAPDGTAYLAGIDVPGEMRGVVPGKVQVLRSQNSTTYDVWETLPVDYRAIGGRAILSAVDADNMWLATDQGMILKLSR